LRLPPELRNQVYENAIGDHVICIYPSWYIKTKHDRLPPLLHVCRQTRAETATLFFSDADFKIESLEKLSAFATTLKHEHRQALRTISLDTHAVQQFGQGGRGALALSPSLKTVSTLSWP
jgi:hypothetical protein